MNFTKITYVCLIGLSSIILSCQESPSKQKLPILGPREAVNHEMNGEKEIDTLYKTIPDFSFLNQDSVEITNNTFDHSIYVADFFFTSCPSICPTMHKNLLKVYKKYQGNDAVMFLSHSIDPKYDTPSVLKAYATKLGVEGNQWQFATGARDSIYNMASDYMVFTPIEDKNAPGGFEHQGWFILIDKDKHIRGAYDGTNDEQVAKLMEDIDILLSEY